MRRLWLLHMAEAQHRALPAWRPAARQQGGCTGVAPSLDIMN